jgi:UDP-3-O-[3-hydroxymyristoyl] N-acetylglucosamine deacetylase
MPSTLRLSRSDGPVVFRTARGDARIDELVVLRTDLGVRVRSDAIGLDVDTVEHLLAAFGGLSIRSGVAIAPANEEMPLLDGASLRFAEALASLEPPREAPRLRVLSSGTVYAGASTYVFTKDDETSVEVEVTFDASRIGRQTASWDGSASSFVRDVAWARTFGFRRDGEALLRAGRGRGVDPSTVMVLDDDGAVEAPGAPARSTEFARHKLLDLVGDLYLFGGPPVGKLHATRPGHGATRRAMMEALARRIVGE